MSTQGQDLAVLMMEGQAVGARLSRAAAPGFCLLATVLGIVLNGTSCGTVLARVDLDECFSESIPT